MPLQSAGPPHAGNKSLLIRWTPALTQGIGAMRDKDTSPSRPAARQMAITGAGNQGDENALSLIRMWSYCAEASICTRLLSCIVAEHFRTDQQTNLAMGNSLMRLCTPSTAGSSPHSLQKYDFVFRVILYAVAAKLSYMCGSHHAAASGCSQAE